MNARKVEQNLPLAAKLVLFGAGLLVLKKVLEFTGVIQSAEEKKIFFDINKAYNNDAFNKDFTALLYKLSKKPELSKLTASELINSQVNKVKAANIAVEIYAAGSGAGTNETVIYSQLRRISNKIELAAINNIYLSMYKISLIDYLTDELNDKELGFASLIINNLPEYIKPN
jgi:hypothetical protein